MIISPTRLAATAAAAVLVLIGGAGAIYVLRLLFLTH